MRAVKPVGATTVLCALSVVSAFASALSCSSAKANAPPSAPSPLSGKPLPDFRRPTLAGERVDTQALRGHVIVVKFFADYCEPCKRTLPAVERLSRELTDASFIGVSEDEYRATAESVVARYRLTFPVVHDAGQVLSGRFRVSDLPATFVAGRDGTIHWVGGASQTEDDLRAAIESVR
jgi:peroxiredoxin